MTTQTPREFTRAEQSLIEKHRDFNVHDEWYEFTKDDLATTLKEFTGMDVKESQFSGFWSQGDGASFTCATDNLRVMLDIAQPRLEEYDAAHAAGTESGDDPIKAAVIAYARWLSDTFGKFRLLGRVLDSVDVRTYRSGSMYVHENTMHAEWELTFADDEEEIASSSGLRALLDDEEITEKLRDIARGYYKALEEEHEFQTSDEQVWESLCANGITPDEEEEDSDQLH